MKLVNTFIIAMYDVMNSCQIWLHFMQNWMKYKNLNFILRWKFLSVYDNTMFNLLEYQEKQMLQIYIKISTIFTISHGISWKPKFKKCANMSFSVNRENLVPQIFFTVRFP